MNWIQVKLQIIAERANEAELLLEQCGAVAVTLQDAADEPFYELKPNTTKLWKQTHLIALFDKQDLAINARKTAADFFQLSNVSLEILPDQNWQQAVMDDFVPVKFANKLWVHPSWKQPPEDGLISMCLDPGIAFGTGTHPTTALCLEWLAAEPSVLNSYVIDYGCGSGILSVATTLLGAMHVVATDIDPQALESTTRNASINNITTKQLQTYLPNQVPKIKADIIVANIFANTLIQLKSTLVSLAKSDATILLSGILIEDSSWVIDEFSQVFTFESQTTKNDWVLLVFQANN